MRPAGGGRSARDGSLPGADRAADLDLFVGAQARLGARGGRAGPAIGGRGGRPAVRDDRQLAHLAPDGWARARRPRHRRHERLAHDADGSRDARLGAGAARRGRRPGGDAAGDPFVVRGLRRGGGGPRRRPDRGRPRRPAGGALRPGLLRGRPDQVHVRHGLLHAHAHRRSARPVATRPDHDRRRPARRRTRDVRPRGLGGGRRLAHRLAARQPRDHRRRRRGRGARPFRAGQRRRRLRARVLRPVRAALAERRPGRHRRADPLRDARPTSPGPRSKSTAYQVYDLGVAMAADLGAAAARRAARGRRDDRQRAPDAGPGRHPRPAGGGPADGGDERARGRLRRGPGGRLLERARRAARRWTGPRDAGSRRWTRPAGRPASPAGTRASSGRSAGSRPRRRRRSGGAQRRRDVEQALDHDRRAGAFERAPVDRGSRPSPRSGSSRRRPPRPCPRSSRRCTSSAPRRPRADPPRGATGRARASRARRGWRRRSSVRPAARATRPTPSPGPCGSRSRSPSGGGAPRSRR